MTLLARELLEQCHGSERIAIVPSLPHSRRNRRSGPNEHAATSRSPDLLCGGLAASPRSLHGGNVRIGSGPPSVRSGENSSRSKPAQVVALKSPVKQLADVRQVEALLLEVSGQRLCALRESLGHRIAVGVGTWWFRAVIRSGNSIARDYSRRPGRRPVQRALHWPPSGRSWGTCRWIAVAAQRRGAEILEDQTEHVSFFDVSSTFSAAGATVNVPSRQAYEKCSLVSLASA